MVAPCISTRSTPQALIVMLEDLGLQGGVPSLSRNDSCVLREPYPWLFVRSGDFGAYPKHEPQCMSTVLSRH